MQHAIRAALGLQQQEVRPSEKASLGHLAGIELAATADTLEGIRQTPSLIAGDFPPADA